MYQVAEDFSQALITHGPDRPWALGQAVFLVRNSEIIAAGVVETANEQAALVAVKRRGSKAPKAGDQALFASATAQVWKFGKDRGEIWVNQPIASNWAQGDPACVERGGLTLACGDVVEVGPELALIRVRNALVWPELGDFVREAYIQTKVTAVDGKTAEVPQDKVESWFVGEVACTFSAENKVVCAKVVDSGPTSAKVSLDEDPQAWQAGSIVRSGARNSFVYQVAADQSAIVLTHPFGKPWVAGDTVCAQRLGHEIACGQIRQANEQAAIAFIDLKSDYAVTPGDAARPAGTGSGTLLKDTGKKTQDVAQETEEPKTNVAAAPVPAVAPQTAGPASASMPQETAKAELSAPKTGSGSSLGFGINYTFPSAHYHFGFADHYSIGINFLLMEYPTGVGVSVKGAGALLSLNRYSEGLFQGLWIQLAAGPYSLRLTNGATDESFKILGAVGQIGWKWRWGDSGNFGFGAGVHYLIKFPKSGLGAGFNGLLPALTIEVGFSS